MRRWEQAWGDNRLAGRTLLGSVVAAVLALTMAGAPAADAQDYSFVTSWNIEHGDGVSSLRGGIATDAAGHVYVVDSPYGVQKFTSDGAFITKWGSEGSLGGQFDVAIGVATDAAGNVYVTDRFAGRIQKFTQDGAFVANWGNQGSGDGQFDGPLGVATDAASNVYIADTNNDRIQKFTSDGALITKWGSNGSGDGQFRGPIGVATDSAGNVYVVDGGGNDRVQKFTSDGAFITKWGGLGSGDGRFSFPTGVATDAAGNVYVADSFNHRIQKFTSDGAFITKWGSYGSGPGQFEYPGRIAVDAFGNVYVFDRTERVQKFAPVAPEPGIDDRPPEPGIESGPSGSTQERNAVFTFRSESAAPGGKFQCKLTGQRVPKELKRWRRCTSPKKYTNLKPGKKVFWVRAIEDGLTGEPEKRRWRVER